MMFTKAKLQKKDIGVDFPKRNNYLYCNKNTRVMKRNAFVTILAIATMALSSICTPCQAQSTNSEKAEEPRKNYEFQQVEQVPEFPGGMSALVEYLQQEIKYPKKCREAGIEGRTLITFVVKKNGKIKDIKIVRSSGNKLLDKEAVRVVKKMPKWKPGMHDGKNVNVFFTLPITFKLR